MNQSTIRRLRQCESCGVIKYHTVTINYPSQISICETCGKSTKSIIYKDIIN